MGDPTRRPDWPRAAQGSAQRDFRQPVSELSSSAQGGPGESKRAGRAQSLSLFSRPRTSVPWVSVFRLRQGLTPAAPQALGPQLRLRYPGLWLADRRWAVGLLGLRNHETAPEMLCCVPFRCTYMYTYLRLVPLLWRPLATTHHRATESPNQGQVVRGSGFPGTESSPCRLRVLGKQNGGLGVLCPLV